MVDRDGVVTKTQNTVKATKGEGQARLVGGLGEVLILDGNVANRYSVAGNEALKTTRAVLDRKRTAVLLVCRGRGRVILVVQVASNRAARRGRNPQVRATGIEDNFEILWRCTDGDL